MHDPVILSVIWTLISVGAFCAGASMMARRAREKAGHSTPIESMPLGVPFKIACRPAKLPGTALVTFQQGEPCFVDIPQPETSSKFAPDKVLVVQVKDGKPFIEDVLERATILQNMDQATTTQT